MKSKLINIFKKSISSHLSPIDLKDSPFIFQARKDKLACVIQAICRRSIHFLLI